jgi:colanic acid biosynthesis protein WcaH
MNDNFLLPDSTFEIVIDSVPLISIDFLVKKNNKVLLGRRINKPAQNFFFSIGSRVHKNESIQQSMIRLAQLELNIKLKLQPKFIGVFEHFYDEGFYEGVSTHYINLAYELDIYDNLNLPNDQHSEYKWFGVEELLDSSQVHKYVKDYFRD